MVEGPGVHRVAIAHWKLLLGQRLRASSPNGRFREGAAKIDNQVLALIEAHGKNLFYFFTRSNPATSVQSALDSLPEDTTVVYIHFGLSGYFDTFSAPGPEPRSATRLRLVAEEVGIVALLSANICNYGSLDLYRKKIECLGPDPLREDADKERLWASLQKSRKKIGAVLMDQSLIAGIGNIYRTELLYVIGVHPNQLASSLTRSTFEALWSEAQRLLRVGVLTGSIITVSQDEAGKPFSRLKNGEKRYIYNHRHCRRCAGEVQSWKLAQRTVYACLACQPLTLKTSTNSCSETQKPADAVVQACTPDEDHENKFEESTVQEQTYCSQATPRDMLASTVMFQEELKHKNGQKRGRQTVEHQALRNITTGGLSCPGDLDDDTVFQHLAPTTPQKQAAADSSIRCYKRKRST